MEDPLKRTTRRKEETVLQVVTEGPQEGEVVVEVVEAVVMEEVDTFQTNLSLTIMVIPLRTTIRSQEAAEVTLLEEEAVEGEEDLPSQGTNSVHPHHMVICPRP